MQTLVAKTMVSETCWNGSVHGKTWYSQAKSQNSVNNVQASRGFPLLEEQPWVAFLTFSNSCIFSWLVNLSPPGPRTPPQFNKGLFNRRPYEGKPMGNSESPTLMSQKRKLGSMVIGSMGSFTPSNIPFTSGKPPWPSPNPDSPVASRKESPRHLRGRGAGWRLWRRDARLLRWRLQGGLGLQATEGPGHRGLMTKHQGGWPL